MSPSAPSSPEPQASVPAAAALPPVSNGRALALAMQRLHYWLVKPPADLDPRYADFYPLSNYVHGMGLVAHVYFLLLFWGLGITELALVNVFSVGVFVATVWLSRRGLLDQALLIGGLEVAGHQGLVVLFLGLNAGFQHYVLVLVMGTLFFSHIPLKARVVMAILPTLWYLWLLVYGLFWPPLVVLDLHLLATLTVVNAAMFVCMLMGMAIYFQVAVASARDKAERMAASKTLFLANMSHELRTPLNAILGFAQILGRSADISAAHRERLFSINRSGEHLLALINRILDMSKLEGGKLELQNNPFSLDQLLEELRDMFSLVAQSKGLPLEISRAPELPDVLLGDVLRLRQVLINLLGNALKFTQQGRVAVELSLAPRQPQPLSRSQLGIRLHCDVRDTGIGISKTEQADLFQLFTQTESGRSSRQGTGLGLALSRRIVELMGGEMGVRSKPGFGSRFWFEVELALAAEGAAELAVRGARAEAVPLEPAASPILPEPQPADEPLEAALGSLQAWPAEQRARLVQAVALADFDLTEQLLQGDASSAPQAHPWLLRLLHDYRFDRLLTLAEQAHQTAPQTAPQIAPTPR